MLLQEGDGFFERTAGKLSPKIRKLLEQVGDEKITSIKLFLLIQSLHFPIYSF